MSNVDEYIAKVIAKGDEGSALLRALTAQTLRNNEYVSLLSQGERKIPVLTGLPKEHLVLVHSTGGYSTSDIEGHTTSLVDRLVSHPKSLGAIPLAFANVVDSYDGDLEMIRKVGCALAAQANTYGVSILNGENAILGNRVNPNVGANVSGTMISIIPRNNVSKKIFVVGGVEYATFEHNGNAVYINSDGVGTKTEFYERARDYARIHGNVDLVLGPVIQDSFAMKLDDASKIGARVRVISDVLEHSKHSQELECIKEYGITLANSIDPDLRFILQNHFAENRMGSYDLSSIAINLSGSCVSTIDEERLRSPLIPSDGEYLVAISNLLRPNPRSNGITDKRKLMVKFFGENWHNTSEGQAFMKYLAAPSTVFYPIFESLISQELATSVYHMSGGAYNGKLARPLAEQGLFVKLEKDNLFTVPWQELALGAFGWMNPKQMYSKWPMGNEAFITTRTPQKAIDDIQSYGLAGKVVGQVEKARDGRTGVEISDLGIYFSGKD